VAPTLYAGSLPGGGLRSFKLTCPHWAGGVDDDMFIIKLLPIYIADLAGPPTEKRA
jgi:hypothetical protein